MNSDGDVAALLWSGRPAKTRGPKPGLNLDLIVAEAIALADADGLENLSMKRLAQRLGSGVMSLYRHVPGKDELIGLMLDVIYRQPPVIDDATPWREAVSECALAMRQLFLAHPWALLVGIQAHVVGPNETAWVEAQLKAIANLPVPRAEAMPLILTVSGFVRGAVAPEAQAKADEQFQFEFLNRFQTHTRYPLLTDALRMENPAGESAGFFEFGLERILDGIAAKYDPAPGSSSNG